MKPDFLRLALAIVILLVAGRMLLGLDLAARRDLHGGISVRKAGAALLAVLSLALMAQAKPVLVPDVSARRIEIRYSFTGAQLLLFGAILYPRGRIPENVPDIAVVLRGPVQPILVREKQKIAGIWMNADSSRFRSAPAFYAVASSQPISRAAR